MFGFHRRNRWIKVLSVALLVMLFNIPISAQFEAQLSQYMFHLNTFNPASIGENGLMDIAGQHRIQWVGMPGAPKTTLFSANTPLFAKKKSVQGVGVKFLNDNIGAFSNQIAHFQYAYKRKLKKNKLSIGVDFGFVSVNFIADSIKTANVNSEFHDFMGDEAIPQNDQIGMSLDLSFGLFYSHPKYYFGLSFVHLNNPIIKMSDEKTEFKVRGVGYAVGGYDFKLPFDNMVLKSSALLKTDYSTWQAEASAIVEYKQKYWGGLSYRYQDAVVVFAGLNIISGLTLGYAYDIPTGKMLTVSSGSHELLLKYSFLLDFGKDKNRYKSIRFL